MAFSSSPVIGRAMKSEGRLHLSSSSGLEKKYVDVVKSLLNLLREWENHHLAGKLALALIMKIKDSLGWKLDNIPAGPKLDSLTEACNNLSGAIDKMDVIVHTLQTLAQQINILSDLEQYQFHKSVRYPVFSFGTWDSRKFGTVFQKIADAFNEEKITLTVIMKEAALSPDKSTLTCYIARWNNSACCNNSIIMLVNGLLIESSMSNI